MQIAALVAAGILTLFAQAESSTYRLDSYGIGSGGNAGAESSTYKSYTITGEQSTPSSESATYELQSGHNPTIHANVPAAPNMTNPASYYNKLHIVIDSGSNPNDTKFAIAISTDNFTSTNYVQSDNTVGATLGSEDWQTYSSWGSGTGVDIIGLSSNTTYYVKVKAVQGLYTESEYSDIDTAATVGQSLTFDIDVSSSDTETGAPYGTNFGSLLAGTVTDSPERIWIDFETNGVQGGYVFIASNNAGLTSSAASHTITSATADLSPAATGFGAKSMSAAEASGGPLTVESPYNGSGDNIGVLNTTLRQVYTSSAAIVGGRGSIVLKAKAQTTTPAASDYSSTLTVIAAANF
jgi:hypothetical protein